MKTCKHHQPLHYLNILSLVLIFCLPHQCLATTDITKLSVLSSATTTNKTDTENSNTKKNFRVNSRVYADLLYRFVVSDDQTDGHALHLDCKPKYTGYSFFSGDSMPGLLNGSLFTSQYEINSTVYAKSGMTKTDIERQYSTVYQRRPEVDISLGDSQALALYQLQLFRWDEAGSNFSIDEQVRATQFKERNFFAANDDEISGKNSSSSPVHICLADDPAFEDGPQIGFFSPHDGLCKVASVLQHPTSKAGNSNVITSQARRPYRLLTRQMLNFNYTWVEVAGNTSAGLHHWTAPFNAYSVKLGDGKAGNDHLPSVYIARFKPEGTNNLIILGLQRNDPLPPMLLDSGRLELLTVSDTPEVPFEVLLRLAGHIHPLNSRAKEWKDYFACNFLDFNAIADKNDEQLVLNWSNEQRAIPKLNLLEESRVENGPQMSLQKVSKWKIYHKVSHELSSEYDYLWGHGANGSLFTTFRPFYGRFGPDNEGQPTTNYAATGDLRPLCRVIPAITFEDMSKVPGFLNMRTGRCLASGLNGAVVNRPDYSVLYQFGAGSVSSRPLQWAPYRKRSALVSGALLIDYTHYDVRPQVFLARLKVLNTGEQSGSQNGSTHRMLYGSLVADQNVFRYVEEAVSTKEDGHVTHAIEGAEEKGAQILVISD